MTHDDTFDWRRCDDSCAETGAGARLRRARRKTLRTLYLVLGLAGASLAVQLLIFWLYGGGR
jgi:hypothetical protein